MIRNASIACARPRLCFCGGVFLALVLAFLGSVSAQGTTYALGTTNLLEGPTTGTGSVVLAVSPASGTWTATANAAWLHLDAANQSGTGSTTVVFSYDSNPGATRSGTLAIAGQNLTVTQAGSTYIPAPAPVTALVDSRLLHPYGVAVDGAGNVYIADTWNDAIKIWTTTDNTVTFLIDSGLFRPSGVAVDSAGNVYIADSLNNAIKKWTAANGTVTSLVNSGLNAPFGVAVDGAGNVYIADTRNNAIKKWTAVNGTVTTLADSGLNMPCGVAVDGAGNVYIADTYNWAIKKWSTVNSTVTTLVDLELNAPFGVAVDGAGNVYIADTKNDAIKKWTAANGTVTTLVASGLNQPFGVAVDGPGNIYIADSVNYAIKELPRAFVDPTARLEGVDPGTDTLPVVLPPTANLLPPFAPTSDQPWLTISGIANGVVSFSFDATASTRTANTTLLGQAIPITQVVPVEPPALFSPAMLVDGQFQFAFSNDAPGASFTVLSTTNLALPLADWTVLGAATNSAPGLFQFTTPTSTNDPQRFYRVRSP